MTCTWHLINRCRTLSPGIQRRCPTSTSRRNASTSPHRQSVLAAAATERSPKPFGDIPGPMAIPMLRHSAHVLPRIGNFHHVVGLGLLEGLRYKYGDLVRLAKGSTKRAVLYVFDPELMRQVYESCATEIPRWQQSPLETHRHRHNSQCSLYGEESKKVWTALRVLLEDGSFMRKYDTAFDEIAADAIRRLGELGYKENSLNKEIETEVYRWALETLGVVILGKRLGCLDGTPHVPTQDHRKPLNMSFEEEALEKCSLSEKDFESRTPPENFVLCSRELADYGYLVQNEKSLKTTSDTFNNALKAFDRHFTLTEHFLRGSLQDLECGCSSSEMLLLKSLQPLGAQLLPLVADTFLAGVEPLTHSAIAMLHKLSLHAARQQRACDELTWRAAVDDAGGSRPEELPYIAACVKEALRLHPATGGVVRRTTEPMILANYEIPIGVDVVLAHGVTSRSECQWGRAEAFLPERWHSQGWEPVPATRAHPAATLPFGTECPASTMVIKMLSALTARVLEKYRLEWHGPPPSVYTSGVNRIQPPYYFVLKKN